MLPGAVYLEAPRDGLLQPRAWPVLIPPERWRWGDRGFHQSSGEIARFRRPQGGVGRRIWSNLRFFSVGDSTDFESKLPQFQNKSEKTLVCSQGKFPILSGKSLLAGPLRLEHCLEDIVEQWCIQQRAHKSGSPYSLITSSSLSARSQTWR